MPIFRPWDIVKLPFPYADRSVRQRRPALVISAGELLDQHGLLWVLMITSAENRGWPSDVPVSGHLTAGLPVPSVVRTAKVAVIDAHDAKHLGVLQDDDRAKVAAQLRRLLGGALIGT